MDGSHVNQAGRHQSAQDEFTRGICAMPLTGELQVYVWLAFADSGFRDIYHIVSKSVPTILSLNVPTPYVVPQQPTSFQCLSCYPNKF